MRLSKSESTPGDGDRPVVLVVVPTKGRHRGTVLLRFSYGRVMFTQVVTTKRSSAEIVVEGFRLAMERLSEFEGSIRLHVRNAVVRGHVFSRHRVRSPRILRQWDLLVPFLDERVELVDADGTMAKVEAPPPRAS